MGKVESKLIFLGTAGDVFTMSNQFLASGGIFFQYGEIKLIIDPGPGSIVYAKKMGINIRDLTGILISNNSILKSSDVKALISSMTYDGLDKKGILIQNKESILLDNANVEKLFFLSPFEGLTELALSNVEIKAMPTYGNNSIGFKIITSDFSLVYSGDTNYHNNLIEFYNNPDFLILNMPLMDKIENSKNEMISIIEKVQPKLTIITSFGIKMINRDILNDIRDIQKATGIQCISAKDNFSLNIEAYI